MILIIIITHFVVSEIDECFLGIHNCMQLCENLNGSYACNCQTGYALNPDGYTCRGNKVYTSKYNIKAKFQVIFSWNRHQRM